MLILDTDHFSELLSLKSAASKALHARLAAADDVLTRNTRDLAAISGLAIADWTSVP